MSSFFDSDTDRDGSESSDPLPVARKPRESAKGIADSIYARLRDAILNAELRANQRLIEDELADWLNVSRTPIREALICLEKDGLVERNNGWIVHEHSPAEIKGRIECRLFIESFAARLASARRSKAQIQELCALAEKMEMPGLPGIEFYRLNDQFHQLIVEAAGNATLDQLYHQVKMNYWSLGGPVIYSSEADLKIHENHRALLEAIRAGDGDQAELIARRHVQQHMEMVLEYLGIKE